MRLLMGDITAVAEGLKQAGADDTKHMFAEGAIRALEGLPRREPFRIKTPLKLLIRRKDTAATGSNPYFAEKEVSVQSPLDIIGGT